MKQRMYQVELPDGLTAPLLARMRCVWRAGMPLMSGTEEAMSLSEGIRPSMLPFARVDSVELSGGGGPRRVRKGGEWATTPPLTVDGVWR